MRGRGGGGGPQPRGAEPEVRLGKAGFASRLRVRPLVPKHRLPSRRSWPGSPQTLFGRYFWKGFGRGNRGIT